MLRVSLRRLTFGFGRREGTLKDERRAVLLRSSTVRQTVLPLFSDTREREGDEFLYERLNDRIVNPATSQYFSRRANISSGEREREGKKERARERERERDGLIKQS